MTMVLPPLQTLYLDMKYLSGSTISSQVFAAEEFTPALSHFSYVAVPLETQAGLFRRIPFGMPPHPCWRT
jgi:hypothetical protein